MPQQLAVYIIMRNAYNISTKKCGVIMGEYEKLTLDLYYLSEKRTTWQQVADEMGYSEREVLRFHGDALVEMEKIIENEQ